MPDLYARDDYDLAGFCVGVVERKRVIDGKAITPGDQIIGVASTGLHSNGYSLARKAVFDVGGHKPDDFIESCGKTVGDLLLEPTRIYAKPVRAVLNNYRVKHVIHGIAHITGGGLHENLVRIIPEGSQAVIGRDSWPVPPVFRWIQQLGEIDEPEMERVFNMGIGLVFVVSPYYAQSIRHQLTDLGLENWLLGHIVDGPQNVVWGK